MRARYEREHERYVRLRRELHRAQGVLAARLVAIYKADQPDFLTVVLESDGFSDLLVRADYMSAIGEQDSVIVDRVRELKRIRAEAAAVRGAQGSAEAAVEMIEAQQRELAETRAGDPEPRGGSRRGAREQARQARRRARAPPRARGRHARAGGRLGPGDQPAAGGGPVPAGPIRQGGGGYIWPVNGPVVSGSGMRWGRLHAGVDIAAPAGTPIRAAASGTVAMAGWMGGYGQYTCIQHGGGIATCYAHQSSIGVGSAPASSRAR